MNDQLLMENYLLVLKSTVEVFVHGTLESSNHDCRELLKQGLNDILDCQAKCYDEMTKQDWYQVTNVDSSVISDTLTQLQNNN